MVGGCGFLGRHLAEGLLAKGYEVQVFDLRKTFDDDRIRFFTGDLCKKEVGWAWGVVCYVGVAGNVVLCGWGVRM